MHQIKQTIYRTLFLSRVLVGSLVLILFTDMGNQAAAQTVGRINTVRSELSLVRAGQEQDGAPRTLLQRDDLLETNNTGRAFLQFIDRTSLQLAPNSRVVLSEPMMKVDQGKLRLIGGQRSKSKPDASDSGVRIQTPQALVVVRGGIADMEVTDGKSAVLLRFGRLDCQSLDGAASVVVTTPGHGCLMRQEPGKAGTGEAKQWAWDFLQADLDAVPTASRVVAGSATGAVTGFDLQESSAILCGFQDGLEVDYCSQANQVQPLAIDID